jgi:predicted transcriptional regulator
MKILEMLQDTKWHNILEIRIEEVSSPDEKLSAMLRFLEEEGFIETQPGKLRISSKGLRLLKLQTNL